MKRQARSKFILQLIDQKGAIEVGEIVRHCRVSPITARRDLEELAGKGYLTRTHGGAIKDESLSNLFSFVSRMDNKRGMKIEISKFAAQLIQDHDTIFLDCGTTIFHITRFLQQRKNLKVITNSLSIATELSKFSEIKVIMIGGDILSGRRAAYGPTACNQIHQYHANKAFIGTDGLSLTDGLSSYDDYEAQIVLAMAEVSDSVYLLCDSSKIEKNSVFKFAPVTLPDVIITDKLINEAVLKQYQEKNINIVLA